MGAIAEVRHIQLDSAEGYLAEAITAGAAYDWHRLAVPRDVLAAVAAAAASAWESANSSSCAGGGTVPSEDVGATEGGTWDRAGGGQDEVRPLEGLMAAGMDLTRTLQDKGVSVKMLKERLPESVRYGQIRLTLAHIGRLGLLHDLLAEQPGVPGCARDGGQAHS